MFIYFHWAKDGGVCVVQAFHKAESAASFVINHISDCIGKNRPAKKKVPFYRAGVAQDGGIVNIFLNNAAPVPAIAHAVPVNLDLQQPFVAAQRVNIAGVLIPEIPDDLLIKKKVLKKKDDVCPELAELQAHLEKAAFNLEDARVAIDLYENYLKYVVKNESSIHIIQDVKVVDQ